jgi:putative N6-adenine-specific DNA methylase
LFFFNGLQVDVEDASLPLVVYLHRGAGTVYRSLGGSGSLHKRGYRSAMHAASLRETLAAGCLELAGWGAAVDAALAGNE